MNNYDVRIDGSVWDVRAGGSKEAALYAFQSWLPEDWKSKSPVIITVRKVGAQTTETFHGTTKVTCEVSAV